uniref:Uncharacterized protein LOC104244186 isoform X3 n=1 Tax=Nicotiana sylvestris TaxID=4096 RepID=A0A1U7YGB6_NICSY|nr:PREDICTED: uncharacterized protein LOC104244186 isoform X3 [Nicotiana sylvestris]
MYIPILCVSVAYDCSILFFSDIANVKATLISAKYHGNGMLLFILHLFTLMEDYLITQTRIQNTSANGDVAYIKATLIFAKYHGNGMLLFIFRHLFTLMEEYISRWSWLELSCNNNSRLEERKTSDPA